MIEIVGIEVEEFQEAKLVRSRCLDLIVEKIVLFLNQGRLTLQVQRHCQEDCRGKRRSWMIRNSGERGLYTQIRRNLVLLSPSIRPA